ncbi:hypothetical protein BT63DRAFT_240737 [Microthyrium microscopicum]|uniref:Uncharacterized protein n=1 Tax=Microthyrium microscopicum TaxID=703497 RepID=A0A6A6UE22_9PEZI|nr:hypothetical protein BT63DRAFT_240737 [Microthyrium microscopicum]
MEEDIEKYRGKSLREYPDHKWTASKQAKLLVGKYALQSDKCDQDKYDMYFYNDFTAYGEQEIVENMIVDFATEFKKKTRSPLAIWSCIEAAQLHLNIHGTEIWYTSDDGDRVAKSAIMLASALLAALGVLKQEDLLKPASPIPNISLVVAMFFRWITDFENIDEDEPAIAMIIALMKEQGLEIAGLHDVEFMSKFDEEIDDDEMERVKSNKKARDPFGFLDKYKLYVEGYGTPKIGGSKFDLTKLSKAERKEAHFDKKDPFADAPAGYFTTPPTII